jgi:putative membrane protein
MAMVAWFAGLFYLPRLFVYHALAQQEETDQQVLPPENKGAINYFKTMERKLYRGIMNPSAILTIVLGLYLLHQYCKGLQSISDIPLWIIVKLIAILFLIGYHLQCGVYQRRFRDDKNTHSHIYFRWINEVPVLMLGICVVMVIVKPI